MACVVLFSIFGCINEEINKEESNYAKKFQNQVEIDKFLESNQKSARFFEDVMIAKTSLPMEAINADGSANDYSETNVQVKGVDEADFVKNDGRYIYFISENRLLIADAFPVENAKIISETMIKGRPIEFFINKDKLILFSEDVPVTPIEYAKKMMVPRPFHIENTIITQYDISNREKPIIYQETAIQGNYFDSRMIGEYTYAIINKNVYDDRTPPKIYKNGLLVDDFPDTYYFDMPADYYRYTNIVSISSSGEIQNKVYLTGSTSSMFVSKNNIYLISPIYNFEFPTQKEFGYSKDYSSIHRIEIEDGKIDIEASGKVPGHVLNQFSMDEYNGNFRIATTSGTLTRSSETTTTSNNLYILDEKLDTIGKLEDIAKGETIYSARFMGEKAYIVTFKKVDPLFVIDISEPKKPEILGKLKIPGYSDYLHPVNDTHIIGLGKEAIPSEDGDFSWYQGVKLSLFDVSDFEKPKEISKFEIGDRGTDSYALSDHKAFLFDNKKDLLVLPITLAEIDEDQYVDIEPWQHGDYVFQGAYIFSFKEGFELKGKVSHADPKEFSKSGDFWISDNSVKRALYIGNVLYTISDSKIKMNDLGDLKELGEIEIFIEEDIYLE